jgi:hypothetical protein
LRRWIATLANVARGHDDSTSREDFVTALNATGVRRTFAAEPAAVPSPPAGPKTETHIKGRHGPDLVDRISPPAPGADSAILTTEVH